MQEQDLTTEELLKQVESAITAVMCGGQSYQLGNWSLTRADLSALRALRRELKEQLTGETSAGMFSNTYAAEFEGR